MLSPFIPDLNDLWFRFSGRLQHSSVLWKKFHRIQPCSHCQVKYSVWNFIYSLTLFICALDLYVFFKTKNSFGILQFNSKQIFLVISFPLTEHSDIFLTLIFSEINFIFVQLGSKPCVIFSLCCQQNLFMVWLNIKFLNIYESVKISTKSCWLLWQNDIGWQNRVSIYIVDIVISQQPTSLVQYDCISLCAVNLPSIRWT